MRIRARMYTILLEGGFHMAASSVLIVENEILLAKDVAGSLETLGYNVAGIAVSGEEAVRLVDESQPDLVLLDIKLAGDMDGIEAANRIRSRFDIPIVYLTGYAERDVVKRAKQTEPYGYLGKPITLLELNSTIETALYKHEADKRVRESAERLRSTLETVHDFIFVLNKDGLFVDYHQPPDMSKLYLPPEQFLRRHFNDVLPKDTAHLLRDAIQSVSESGLVRQFDYAMLMDGELSWFSAKVSPRRSSSGDFDGVTIVSRDITHRKKAEALTLAQRDFSIALNSVSDLDEAFRICVDFALEISGMDVALTYLVNEDGGLEPAIHRGASEEFLAGMAVQGADSQIAQLVMEGKPVHCTGDAVPHTPAQADGGGFQTITVLPVLHEGRVIACFELASRDVNEMPTQTRHALETLADQVGSTIARIRAVEGLRRANEELEKSHKFLRLTLSSLNEAVFVVSPSRVITDCNKAAEEMFGYTRDEMVGRNTGFLHVSDEMFLKFGDEVTRTLRDGNPIDGGKYLATEFEMIRRNREVFPTDHYVAPIFDEHGKHLSSVSVVREITERKRAEEALRESERIRYVRDRISRIFLTVPDEEMYREVLQVVLDAMRSKYGFLGYVNQEGNLVAPIVKKDVWEECRIADKAFVYTPGEWKGIWGRALAEKQSLFSNEPSHVTVGHLPVSRSLVVPLIHRGEVVGLLHVAGKESDYGEYDRVVLETIGNYVAPILHARLERQREERRREKAEARIKESLKEKEVLLREIHHRVKNNLAIIHSLLGLQSRRIADSAYSGMFEDSRNRIRSMALAHELLYQSSSLAYISVDRHLGSLVDHLVVTAGTVGTRVSVFKDLEKLSFDLDTAIPVGFLVTEIVSNSLKHAFQGRKEGEIRISLHSVGEKEFELIVADNGIGMPAHVDVSNPRSLGLDIVSTFVSQVNGTIEIRTHQGTEVRIRFKEAQNKKPKTPWNSSF
jgi:PAS domain S-box-containing protein